MTTPVNTQLTYSTIGNREDLADKIFMISPTQTPFIAHIGEKKATNTWHEWQVDSLTAAGSNAQPEGSDFSPTAFTPTVRIGNRSQISSKEFSVSGTQQSMNPAGRTKEMVYQMMKASKALRTDQEHILLSNQAPVTGAVGSGGNGVASQLRPLVGFYATNIVDATSGFAAGTSTTAATDGGTTAVLTEALVLSASQLAWAAGGDPDLVLLSAKNKVAFSQFTGSPGTYKNMAADTKKLYNTVSVYVSDFNELRVIPDHFVRTRDVHVLDCSNISIANLRPLKTIDIAKVGDSDRGKILVEYTLEVGNEAASALIADTTGV